MLDDLDK